MLRGAQRSQGRPPFERQCVDGALVLSSHWAHSSLALLRRKWAREKLSAIAADNQQLDRELRFRSWLSSRFWRAGWCCTRSPFALALSLSLSGSKRQSRSRDDGGVSVESWSSLGLGKQFACKSIAFVLSNLERHLDRLNWSNTDQASSYTDSQCIALRFRVVHANLAEENLRSLGAN